MKVAELSGGLLDYWVAQAGEVWAWAHELFPTMTLDPTFRGCDLVTEGGRTVCRLVPSNPFRQDYQIFEPSMQWQHGGPIIERERGAFSVDPDSMVPRYFADMGLGTNRYRMGGPTHLIAAMRAFVASKFGAEVPDEVRQP